MASLTSRAFPTAHPRGCFMLVRHAPMFLPNCLPTEIIRLARFSPSSMVGIADPSPNLTSSSMTSSPHASFFDMIEETISGRLFTVPVTSLSAYSFLSAGQRLPVCPIMAMPMSLTCLMSSSLERNTFIPGMELSLSTVPPMKPSAPPDIFATLSPHEATRGISAMEVLSPTPPEECLSTLIPAMSEKSSVSPE